MSKKSKIKESSQTYKIQIELNLIFVCCWCKVSYNNQKKCIYIRVKLISELKIIWVDIKKSNMNKKNDIDQLLLEEFLRSYV